MIIAAMTAIGFAAVLLALCILMPCLAYAAWHGYRETPTPALGQCCNEGFAQRAGGACSRAAWIMRIPDRCANVAVAMIAVATAAPLSDNAVSHCFGALCRPGVPMTAALSCPQCTLTNTYQDGAKHVCADCGFEWPAAPEGADAAQVVRDSNGNLLADGDTVVVIKDLKVKGASIPLKQGTVIKHIRLVDGDAEHIEGHSDKIKGLVLKTCFLRKA